MKKLLLAVVVLVFLPKAHATCSITLSPSTSTLQTKNTETLTATITGTGCGATTTWNPLTCTPTGSRRFAYQQEPYECHLQCPDDPALWHRQRNCYGHQWWRYM